MGTSGLADSNICRLCGAESENTISIFDAEDEEPFCIKINKYLPFQVFDDGRHPRRICSPCHGSVSATQVFLDRVLEGQYTIHALLHPDRPAPPDPAALYAADNALRGQLLADEVLQKRRRGRPRKGDVTAVKADPKPAPAPAPAEPPPALDRSRRPRGRLPARFQNSVKGRELERVLGGADVAEAAGDGDGEGETGAEGERAPCHVRVEVLSVPGEAGSGQGGSTSDQDQPETLEEFQPSDAEAATPFSRKRRRQARFQCEVCGKQFQMQGRLKFHRALHRGVRFECLGCSARFKLGAELAFHQTETGHTGQGVVEGVDSEPLADRSRVPCTECPRSFASKWSLHVHQLQRHNADKRFECPTCHKKFGQLSQMRMHEKSHTTRSQPRTCAECGKECNSRAALAYHTEAAHGTPGRLFMCNLCGKGFRNQHLLSRHGAVHITERNFKCPECPSSFKTKGHLTNHMVRHTGEKKHACPLCPQRFGHKTALTFHIRWHKGEKPHECSVCKKRFSQRGNLVEHERIHTGEKPFPCTVCSRAFATNCQLSAHMRSHGAGRPLLCRPCGKTFTSRDRWRAHCRLHGTQRPLACPTCGKQMDNKWTLMRHMRTHTGKASPADAGASLVCGVCSWSCEDASALQRHQEEEHTGGGDGPELLTTGLVQDTGPLLQLDGKPAESQVIYVTCQNPADPSTVQLIDGIAAVGGARPVQLSADSEVLLEDAADGVVQLAANKGLVTGEGTRTLELTTEDGRRIQITLQDVKGDLEPAELAVKGDLEPADLTAAVAPSEVGGVGQGVESLHVTAEDTQEVDGSALTGESVDVLVTASDGRQFRLVTPAGSDPVQLATEYIAGLESALD
ncbi:zinc finger protein 497-like isoform X2 [Amphibalanus amphitrite]|uniref:zinc finger protein 497-like isoform X2 n=1 Tax=Amphibalanus amphitrite TaxID=1232801 RepID=UPI001C90BB16|nr:zinc finger protein 497-like isoform X2 [Amphibalanus amphitrite]XP_043219327.1 zinc finger protein 497-like isoform X2 [Amphibalanus amphitrite]XP_043219328.1 zinc finger protein 497-like isoform X2 [Amphibalanus amphitrite]